MANTKSKTTKKEVKNKKSKGVSITNHGRVFITCTYNNTIISITNSNGDVVCWSSPGNVGFKGAKTATPYAASLAAESASKVALEKGIQAVEVITKGPGIAKISAIKSIRSSGLKVSSIRDVTPFPHNGCRAKKKRRM